MHSSFPSELGDCSKHSTIKGGWDGGDEIMMITAGNEIMIRLDECSVLDSSLLMELTIQMYVCPSQFQEERGNAENTSMPISRDFYSTLLL